MVWAEQSYACVAQWQSIGFVNRGSGVQLPPQAFFKMVWQDIVMGIMNVIFSYALIPQIFHGFKSKKGLIEIQTSLISSIGLFILAFTVLTLKLYFAAGTTFLAGLLWSILLIQKLIYKK